MAHQVLSLVQSTIHPCSCHAGWSGSESCKPAVQTTISVTPYLNRMNRRVDFYFSKAPKWQEALEQLRTFLLACVPALKTAFNALTPGQQRAYLLYFAAPKQAKTRAARAEKWVPQILQGKGLQE